ncbi:MAG: hypothetical protein RXS23_04880 [Metallosphaera yellowstonensis]|jgi:hypothetical protein|uniref:Uncharacterized protein n=1 Tax=Metallosphaera yellowstonensis MK1 TaxID=671065 RepID=H2C9I4_9CREN|nr:hypothetical protein [Metallosphaera yellowstonensis]EHP68810.1 hypothetical protein MetMK1DRAFT_00032560 [Metallosphaera yellowstonensis MK1]
MMITERVIEDARFYGKLIVAVFSDEGFPLNIPDSLSKRLTVIPVNPEEHPEYLVRLTRGIIPAITVMTPSLEIVGIIESANTSYIVSSLRELVDNFVRGNVRPYKISPYVPEPQDPPQDASYEVISKILDGYPADFRTIELVRTFVTTHKEYEKVLKVLKPLDDIASFYLEGGTLNDDFAVYEAVKVIKGERGMPEAFLGEDGRVLRRRGGENWGLLVDEALVGFSFLSRYLREGTDEDLERAKRIFSFVRTHLETERGYRDSVPRDPLTRVEFLEPLANSELAIFLSALWQVTQSETVREKSLKALRCASSSQSLPVKARIALATLRLEKGILVNKPGRFEDSRVMLNKSLDCNFKYSGKCYDTLEAVYEEYSD